MPLSRLIPALAAVLILIMVGSAACESGDTGSPDSFLSDTGLPADAVVITDPQGDVRDVDGKKPPEDSRAPDIVRAAIHLSDTELTLALEHAAPIPSQLSEVDFAVGVGEWLHYTVFIADEQGTIIYMPQIGLAGSEWSAYMYDKVAGETAELEGGPQISGSMLTYAFPRASMLDLRTPFKWGVGATWERMSDGDLSNRLAFGDQATEDGKNGWGGYPYEWADYPQ